MKVAVIGAGVAGLVALRHLTSDPAKFTVVAYEMTCGIGGTWVYNESIGTNQDGQPIHSSMYKNLRTNLPMATMAFPDFPYKDDGPSFVSHEIVLQYLQDYAKHFDILKYIKFNTLVEKVTPLKSDYKTRWQVNVRSNAQEGATQEVTIFDAVVVANGHFSVPLIPELPGLKAFKGKVIHSHDYRHPEAFKNKTVVCLGASSSGQDISLELCGHAKQVYLAHKKKPFISGDLPQNLKETSGIKQVLEDSVLLDDCTRIENVDVLLLCTGYHYTFPFLSKECHLSTEGERVYPLYKHVIHAEYPTLSIIGVCKYNMPLLQIYLQVRFTVAAWNGSMILPSEAEMKADIDEDYKDRLKSGLPHRYSHHMGDRMLAYNTSLAKLGGFTPLPNVVQKIFDYVLECRYKNLCHFKNLKIKVIDNENFVAE